uniref:Uncharacterized protein n=1 Tax=Rhizophora mucronata TaxID=61149 RepID=A0A2P2NX28_RHIMU
MYNRRLDLPNNLTFNSPSQKQPKRYMKISFWLLKKSPMFFECSVLC